MGSKSIRMGKLLIEQKLKIVQSRIIKLDLQLSEEQLDFILHPMLKNCYLSACPGSGKTEVVGIKAAYEIAEWKDNFCGIAVLSFTKNAAKEISDRIKKYSGVSSVRHPHFVGTIDSWLHSYLLHPFAHKTTNYDSKTNDKSFRIIDNEERYDFLNSFKTVLSVKPYKDAWVNEYYFECTDPLTLQSQSRYLDLSSVLAPIKKTLEQNKKKLLKAGLATYADAEFLCYYMLKNRANILALIAKRFPVIYIDECQDLSLNQLEILQLLNDAGTKVHFIGDRNQSIYEFKKVYVEKINNFIIKNGMTEIHLTKNFRSNQNIVNVAMGLESCNTGKTSKKISGHEALLIQECCLVWEYETVDFISLPQNFINIIKDINLNLSQESVKIEINNSVILARAHNTLSLFKNTPGSKLSKIELIANALSCWSNTPRTGKDMQNALHQLGKSLCMLGYNGSGNHQNQYCPENYTNFEWRALLFDLITNIITTENKIFPFDDVNWKDWTASLKVFLKNYWDNLRDPNDWDSVKTKIKSPSGFADKPVIETVAAIQNSYTNSVRMTTFHDVKGETLDAALIVSSPNKKSKGGHFEHWISQNSSESEYVRFAYVASSRPKHLLIWAIPKVKNNKHLKRILELGFRVKSFK